MKNFITAIITAVVTLGFIFTTSAFAQEAVASGYTIDLGPVVSLFSGSLQEIILTILGALVAWVLKRWGSFLGQSTQDTIRGYVMSAIENGVHKYASQLLVSGASWQKISTSNELVAQVANYALTHVPEGLTKLGVDPASLNAIIAAQVGKWVGTNYEVQPVTVPTTPPAA